jgi:lipoprotein-anchoring transpeptidase ErfK/SrfK
MLNPPLRSNFDKRNGVSVIARFVTGFIFIAASRVTEPRALPTRGNIPNRRARHSASTIAATLLFALALWSEASFAREPVRFNGAQSPGTIVVRTAERRLYLVISEGKAMRYSVGVGRSGKQWFGTTHIVRKALRPAWSPPAEIRGSRPAWVVPAGAPNNPMGAAALVLADNELAIHGTNNPGSVGGLVSWGCIRMRNQDILDLYERVSVGTRVVLMR